MLDSDACLEVAAASTLSGGKTLLEALGELEGVGAVDGGVLARRLLDAAPARVPGRDGALHSCTQLLGAACWCMMVVGAVCITTSAAGVAGMWHGMWAWLGDGGLKLGRPGQLHNTWRG